MKASVGKKAIVLVFFLLFGLAIYSPSYGQDGKYTLYELGTLGGPNTYAYDINDSSLIVGVGDTDLYNEGTIWQAFTGTKDGISRAFSGGDRQILSQRRQSRRDRCRVQKREGVPDGGGQPVCRSGDSSRGGGELGVSINSGKKVAGYSWNEGVWEKGALWEQDGSGSDIGTLGGGYTRATSVNDADEIAGYSQTAEGSNRAFRWKKILGNEPLADLGVLGDFTDSFGLRINNKGTVVGYSLKYDEFWNETNRACLWGGNGVQELKKNSLRALETILQSQAYGINDADVVVGTHWVEKTAGTGVKQ